MTKHSQSLFLIEQLQPDWLEEPWRVWCYLIVSRTLQCMVLAVLLECLYEITDLVIADPSYTFETFLPEIAGLSAVAVCMAGLCEGTFKVRNKRIMQPWLYLLAVALLMFVFGATIDSDFAVDTALFLPLIAFHGMRTLGDEIHTSEQLSWSWRNFARGFIFLNLLPRSWMSIPAMILLILVSPIFTQGLGEQSLFVFTLCLVFGAIAAIRARVTEAKTRPNMGMHLSLRNAAIVILAGLLLAVAIGLLLAAAIIMLRRGEHLFFLVTTMPILIAVYAAGWFGGMDVIAHYTLRVLLALFGYAPLNYPRFLNYASGELHFLQKVGGGYAFMHRYLREYFASEEQMKEAALV